MNVLILGSGGREHALAWKISASAQAEKVYLHPGNDGVRKDGVMPFESDINDVDSLIREAKSREIGLVVVGPETLLAKGYADTFRKDGFLVVGPNQIAAQIEASKSYAKDLMDRAHIPTAGYHKVQSLVQLQAFLEKETQWPMVLKLNGLAAGKGVAIVENAAEGLKFGRKVFEENAFGEGPQELVLEDYLKGREISFIGLCDGETFLPMATATDFKRVGEKDTGPNTGGMGCVSPSPFFSEDLQKKVEAQIIAPLFAQWKKEGIEYRGVLYIGLMVDDTGEPKVLEFNARFGDPETQVTLLRLESDFLELLTQTAKGKLSTVAEPKWSGKTGVYVVAAAEGYPENVQKGDVISGLDEVTPSAKVFFAGVSQQNGELITSGGRVLGVGCLENTLELAIESAYQDLRKIRWRGQHYRKDIGQWS